MHLLNVLFGDGIVAAVGPVLICSMVDSIISKCFLPGQRCVGLILSDLVVQQGLHSRLSPLSFLFLCFQANTRLRSASAGCVLLEAGLPFFYTLDFLLSSQ